MPVHLHGSTRSTAAAAVGMSLRRCAEVWKLGTVGYSEALKLQQKLLAERKAGKIADTVLSLQHPPTFTLGKRRTYHNLLLPEADLNSIGAELHLTERGGDVTFHGPHQAVLYPIVSLREIGYGARRYVESLQAAMVRLAALYGVQARAGAAEEVGVWVEDRKIGAVGVRISGGFTCHGLAFNIDPDLSFFRHIVPCGISDKDVTTLRREAAVSLPADEVIQEQLTGCLVEALGYDEVIWREKSEDLLQHLRH